MSLSVAMLRVGFDIVMLTVSFYCYTECHSTDCRYADSRGAIGASLISF
jgi:hypothetical protein